MYARIYRVMDGDEFLGCRVETSPIRSGGYQFWCNHLTENAAIKACERNHMDYTITVEQPPYHWLGK